MLRANFNPNPNNEKMGKHYDTEFLVVNGKTFPMARVDSGKQTASTMVTDGRNALAVFIGQKIGRDQSKIEYVCPALSADEWSEILMIFNKNFVNNVTFFDMVTALYFSFYLLQPLLYYNSNQILTAHLPPAQSPTNLQIHTIAIYLFLTFQVYYFRTQI